MARTPQVYFDPRPLLEQARLAIDLPDLDHPDCTIRSVNDVELGAYIGVSHRTVFRWRHGARVTELVADRAALALGLHPVNIWPDWGQRDDEQDVA